MVRQDMQDLGFNQPQALQQLDAEAAAVDAAVAVDVAATIAAAKAQHATK